jgi:preprotein translocase subunit YajC
MFHALILFADDQQQPGGGLGGMLPLFIILGVMFWLMLIRPMRKQERERQSLLSSLKKNDKVITSGGIYGIVVGVAEKEDEVTVKVDDNVRLKMLKSSILRNLTNEEAARAAKETKPSGA